MKKPVIAINLHPRDYSGHTNLALRVAYCINNNPYFTSPTPSIADLRAQTLKAIRAQANWGIAGNRGAHKDVVQLRHEVTRLGVMLKSMAQYVQNAAQLQGETDYSLTRKIMSTSGFTIKKAKSRQGGLAPVRGLQTRMKSNLNRNQVFISWEAPLNVSSYCNVLAFNIYRGTTLDFRTAECIATQRKTSFIDTNNTGETVKWFYFIVPISRHGAGAISTPLIVPILPA
jgi:hypothetical protein